jgi:hypothetical protein
VRQRDVRLDLARGVARSAALLSVLHLLAVLAVGAWWVTADWSALECFDGTEPECGEPDPGLSDIRASSWALAWVALMAALGALVLALRLRRVAYVAPVLVLCAASAVVAQVLWARL